MISEPLAEDRDLLARLSRAVAEGRVRLDLDSALLTHVHSPLASQAEANLPMYAGLAAAGAVGWFWRWEAGIAIAGALLLWFATMGRRLLMQRVRRRIERETLRDLEQWQRLWRFGGVVLARSDAAERATAPAESWQRLASGLPGAGGPQLQRVVTRPAGRDRAPGRRADDGSAPPPRVPKDGGR